MKPVQVILNPHAGRGAGARAKESLVRALRQAQVGFELTETTGPGHAQELASAMRTGGVLTVVAAGGDGTVNEVINGLAQVTPDGESIGKLAPFPIGTGNDFSDMTGMKRGAEALAQRIAAGRTRLVDLGRGQFTSDARQITRYFGNNVGLGFEAQVTVDSYTIKGVQGPLRYLLAVFKALGHFTSPPMEISWKNGSDHWAHRSLPTFMVSMGNSRRTGGMFYVTPDAQMDDGLLDVAIVPHKTKLEALQMLPKTFTGAHRNDPRILFVRCVEVKVQSAQPVPVHLDGEVIMDDVKSAHIEVFPSRLEIVV